MDAAFKFGFLYLGLVLLIPYHVSVDAISDGVPSEACGSLSPVPRPPPVPLRKRRQAGHTAAPQTTPPPYEINISSLDGGYSGGCNYCEYIFKPVAVYSYQGRAKGRRVLIKIYIRGSELASY